MDDIKKMFEQEARRSKELNLVVGKVVECGRLLMDEDDIHFLKEKALETAMNWATIESNLASYGRIGASSRKFAATK